MSLISPLHPQNGATINIEALHLNLWLLNTPLTLAGISQIAKRRRFYSVYLDIGVRFQVTQEHINSLSFVFPPDLVYLDSFFDLSAQMKDDSINDLVFGVSTKTSGESVEYILDKKAISDEIVQLAKMENKNGIEVGVVFDKPIFSSEQDKTYYTRFRVECRIGKGILDPKGWGFAKQGYIFNCLVNDIRGSAEIRANSSIIRRLISVNGVYTFLIAPSQFIPVLSSPSLYYSRHLEAGVWRKYLSSCSDIRPKHKYTIHQWRSNKEVNTLSPYRCYMHLQREFGIGLFIIYLFGIFTAPAIGILNGIFALVGWWHF